MRRPMIAGNWKMFKTAAEAVSLINTIKAGLHTFEGDVDVVVCPPFTTLESAKDAVKNSAIGLGAQNMHFESDGAYTGEISPLMLKDLECRYVILGHSERRGLFGETDELINKKVKTALKYNLTPIVCVGEWLEDREAGRHKDVVRAQMKGTFQGLVQEDFEKLVIAYEPVWAIGTGKTATPAQAQEMHKLIRDLITEAISEATAQKVRILYGGSVKSDNINELITQPDVDGGLVGGASLKADSFIGIITGSATESVS